MQAYVGRGGIKNLELKNKNIVTEEPFFVILSAAKESEYAILQ
jgi:hypothetical protein